MVRNIASRVYGSAPHRQHRTAAGLVCPIPTYTVIKINAGKENSMPKANHLSEFRVQRTQPLLKEVFCSKTYL